jgi:hypothetical protein
MRSTVAGDRGQRSRCGPGFRVVNRRRAERNLTCSTKGPFGDPSHQRHDFEPGIARSGAVLDDSRPGVGDQLRYLQRRGSLPGEQRARQGLPRHHQCGRRGEAQTDRLARELRRALAWARRAPQDPRHSVRFRGQLHQWPGDNQLHRGAHRIGSHLQIRSRPPVQPDHEAGWRWIACRRATTQRPLLP